MSSINARHVAFYVILALGVTAASAVSAELVLRAFGGVPTETIHTVSMGDFPRIPGMFEPNQDLIEAPHPKLAHHVTINSLGYRGAEITRAKPANTVRILCLGDSGTYGQYVDQGHTFPEVLQTLLRAKDLPVEVINGGVLGTTIVDQLQFLERSMVLDPDVVLLTFSENDITDLASEEPQFIALERNRRLKSRPLFRFIYRPLRDTAVFNFALKLRATWDGRRRDAASAPPRGSSEHNERLWIEYAANLDRMHEYLSARNVPLVFDAFPTHHRIPPVSISDDMRDQLERVERLATDQGILTIPILPAFLESGLSKEELYLLPYDGHANARANELQAQALLPGIETVVRAALVRPN